MKKNMKEKNIIVKCGADLLAPLATLFGCYVVLHGFSSPGGGFQGGVLIVVAVLMVFLAYGHRGVKRGFNEHFFHSSETVAEIIYVIIALWGVFAGLNFCVNFIFPDIKVLETAMLMNDAVGYHVMGGVTCLLIMMLNLLGDDYYEDDEHPLAEKKEDHK